MYKDTNLKYYSKILFFLSLYISIKCLLLKINKNHYEARDERVELDNTRSFRKLRHNKVEVSYSKCFSYNYTY